MALLKILLETKHFHEESKMVFSKAQFWFFLSLYHVKWTFGYSGARDLPCFNIKILSDQKSAKIRKVKNTHREKSSKVTCKQINATYQ